MTLGVVLALCSAFVWGNGDYGGRHRGAGACLAAVLLITA